jgi:hypothetical protein
MIDLREIKRRFSLFLGQFADDEFALVMQFLELILEEYNTKKQRNISELVWRLNLSRFIFFLNVLIIFFQ